ncbi:unnamed protein product [Bursaphelenchus xylophilus]|uniref:(pine wood nematode) hypothetical protein n=1 Tax=Bursaphelenchus xylophilus TaxID=6326 RepID=A0A1I7RSQ7_BURXY|nr:unnamed protein product [Bursaphelenchus xylophilus]CAG9122835.1 unnamed protein product [Bursaphelenchus xylophilus]
MYLIILIIPISITIAAWNCSRKGAKGNRLKWKTLKKAPGTAKQPPNGVKVKQPEIANESKKVETDNIITDSKLLSDAKPAEQPKIQPKKEQRNDTTEEENTDLCSEAFNLQLQQYRQKNAKPKNKDKTTEAMTQLETQSKVVDPISNVVTCPVKNDAPIDVEIPVDNKDNELIPMSRYLA